MRAERERACDELELKMSQRDERREYGNTMIKLLAAFSGGAALPGAVGILEGQAPLRRRITMIAQFERRQSRTWIALLTTIILALVALTDAAVGDNRRPNPAGGGGGGAGGGQDHSGLFVGSGAVAPRFADVAQDKSAEAANDKTRATLRKNLPEVKFEQVSLSDAIAFIRDVTELNIYVDGKIAENNGMN